MGKYREMWQEALLERQRREPVEPRDMYEILERTVEWLMLAGWALSILGRLVK